MSDWIELGEVGRPHGVRGDLLIQSYTEPPFALAKYPVWHVGRSSSVHQAYKHEGARMQGRGLLVRLTGLSDRDQAAQLTGCKIFVASSELPAVPEGQHYWSDLIGFKVLNLAGVTLGRLDHFVEAPGNPVMVVLGEREHWLPLTPQHLQRVDREARQLLVDWPEDF